MLASHKQRIPLILETPHTQDNAAQLADAARLVSAVDATQAAHISAAVGPVGKVGKPYVDSTTTSEAITFSGGSQKGDTYNFEEGSRDPKGSSTNSGTNDGWSRTNTGTENVSYTPKPIDPADLTNVLVENDASSATAAFFGSNSTVAGPFEVYTGEPLHTEFPTPRREPELTYKEASQEVKEIEATSRAGFRNEPANINGYAVYPPENLAATPSHPSNLRTFLTRELIPYHEVKLYKMEFVRAETRRTGKNVKHTVLGMREWLINEYYKERYWAMEAYVDRWWHGQTKLSWEDWSGRFGYNNPKDWAEKRGLDKSRWHMKDLSEDELAKVTPQQEATHLQEQVRIKNERRPRGQDE